MTRRITCYVVFVSLLWGAHTDDEEKVRNMFKSNMTRNDFSNLLQSLIKLNEQRVSVLQKLYRLEDYGVLSEVLRSGDKKTGNGNPNNLFLIVLSKGFVDAKNIVKKYQVLLDDGESRLAEDKQPANDDDKLYELLGLVTLEAAIKAKQKYVSSDIASGQGYRHQELSTDEATSEDMTDFFEDVPPGDSIEHFHNYHKKGARKQFETRRWHKSCVRKASRMCMKACQKAYKSVCRKRKCSKRARKALKRECKKSCTRNFELDRDRAAYEE